MTRRLKYTVFYQISVIIFLTATYHSYNAQIFVKMSLLQVGEISTYVSTQN